MRPLVTIVTGQRLLRLGRIVVLWRQRPLCVGILLAILCLVMGGLLLGSGTARFAPAEVLGGLFGHSDNASANRLIGRIRLPRLVTAALVGAALGMGGAVFQSLSRNVLGSPDLIGFTTGAASGAICAIMLFNAGPLATALGALASGGLTAVCVLWLARRGAAGSSGGYRLVLVGIGIGAMLSGLNTLLLTMGDLEHAMAAQIWLAGSLEARNQTHVLTAALGLCLFAPLVLLHGRRLSLLEMGDDMASQLGIDVARMRMLFVVASVGLTSIATACAGPIAFIALAGPQLARRLSGSFAPPLLTGALMGAVLLIAADLLSQRLPLPLILPIGLTTGFLGGLYLLVVLSLSRR
jgi:iron complex transport system permease protein